MKWLFVAIATLLLGFGLAEFGDRGYVLMRFAGWTLETSFIFFVTLSLLAGWIINISLRETLRIAHWPSRVRGWLGDRITRRKRGHFARGLAKLAEGYWSEAERYLSHVPSHSEHATLAYLGAAWAAHQQGKHDTRDLYLARTRIEGEHHPLSTALLEAQIALQEQRVDKNTLTTLSALHKQHPKHPQVLRLLAESAAQTHDWTLLQNKLPAVRKLHATDNNHLQKLSQQLYQGLLDEASRYGTETALRNQWKALPGAAQQDANVVSHYAKHLDAMDAGDEAAKILCEFLYDHWDAQCVSLLGQLNTQKPGHWLTRAEQWLTSRPDDAELLLTASRLAFKHELWGKARSYAEASLALQPCSTGYHELAKLQEFLGDTNAALGCYRKAAELLAKKPLQRL